MIAIDPGREGNQSLTMHTHHVAMMNDSKKRALLMVLPSKSYQLRKLTSEPVPINASTISYVCGSVSVQVLCLNRDGIFSSSVPTAEQLKRSSRGAESKHATSLFNAKAKT